MTRLVRSSGRRGPLPALLLLVLVLGAWHPAGGQSATTFRFPEMSHENGEAAGWALSISTSSAMSTGSRPISRHAVRITS